MVGYRYHPANFSKIKFPNIGYISNRLELTKFTGDITIDKK